MIRIRKAKTLEDLRAVWSLTYRTYLAQGYTPKTSHGLLAQCPHFDALPETKIIMAEKVDGSLLGTVSHTLDGPAGLPLDQDFQDLADQVRTNCKCDGLRLGSPWRLATDPACRGTFQVVTALMDEMSRHLKNEQIAVTLYILHPKHVPFYQKVWDLKALEQRPSKGVQGAPAVLMRGDLPRILARWQTVLARRAGYRRWTPLADSAPQNRIPSNPRIDPLPEMNPAQQTWRGVQ